MNTYRAERIFVIDNYMTLNQTAKGIVLRLVNAERER